MTRPNSKSNCVHDTIKQIILNNNLIMGSSYLFSALDGRSVEVCTAQHQYGVRPSLEFPSAYNRPLELRQTFRFDSTIDTSLEYGHYAGLSGESFLADRMVHFLKSKL